MSWDDVVKSAKHVFELRVQVPILISSVALLGAYQIPSVREALGLAVFEPVRPCFALVAIVDVSLIASRPIVAWINRTSALRKHRRIMREALRDLTAEEQAVLARYLDEDKAVLVLDFAAGVANLLEAKRLLERVSTAAVTGLHFAYALQPLAREILRNDPRLLERTRSAAKPATRPVRRRQTSAA